MKAKYLNYLLIANDAKKSTDVAKIFVLPQLLNFQPNPETLVSSAFQSQVWGRFSECNEKGDKFGARFVLLAIAEHNHEFDCPCN